VNALAAVTRAAKSLAMDFDSATAGPPSKSNGDVDV
jgi:hypothetical protein